MSLLRAPLNLYLRLVEKPALARAQDPVPLRRSLERKARLLFRPPIGTRRRMRQVGPLYGLELRPPKRADAQAETHPLILYFHGGGYIFGSPHTHAGLVGRLLTYSGGLSVMPAYRLAPEFPFPSAFQDAIAAYRAVADHPAGVVLGGDSAGGGLALALLAEILRQNMPVPLGVFAFSPLTDLTCSGASFSENSKADAMLPAARAQDMIKYYLGKTSADDPRVSPLFGAFSDAPPVWLSVGTTEILRDDTLRLAERLGAAGVSVSVDLEQDLPHVWPYLHAFLPEARATLRGLAAWIRRLPRPDDS